MLAVFNGHSQDVAVLIGNIPSSSKRPQAVAHLRLIIITLMCPAWAKNEFLAPSDQSQYRFYTTGLLHEDDLSRVLAVFMDDSVGLELSVMTGNTAIVLKHSHKR
jgi:hypothetical protein